MSEQDAENRPTLVDGSGIVIAYVNRLERERDALRVALKLIIANPAFRGESIARAALEAKPLAGGGGGYGGDMSIIAEGGGKPHPSAGLPESDEVFQALKNP